MVLSNLHTHTTFSDGKNTAEEMAEAAFQKGFTLLGFSDHGYTPHGSYSMSLEQEAAYRAEITRLKALYAGRMEILLGYEHDASVPDADLSYYDYVIESVHYLRRGGEYAPIDDSAEILQDAIDRLYGGDPYAMCADYFEEVCRSIVATPGQIIGHIGLVTKFNEGNRMFDASDERYLGPARKAIRCAVEHGKLVEINTGAMSRGYRSEPYPGRELLLELRRLGGKAILASDCHRAEWLDYAFAEQTEWQAELASSCCRPCP